jgi:hypothetical protein
MTMKDITKERDDMRTMTTLTTNTMAARNEVEDHDTAKTTITTKETAQKLQ